MEAKLRQSRLLPTYWETQIHKIQEEGNARRQAGWEKTQMEMRQRWREHDEEMRQGQEELRLLRLQNAQRRENERADEVRRQLQEAEARLAEQRRRQTDEEHARQRQGWTGVLLGAASIGATLALASPLLFPQVGQGKEGEEEEEKKAARWRGTIQVETVDGKYVRMNLPEFVAALFEFEDFESEIRINFQEGDDPELGTLVEQRNRLRAIQEELVSFVASDRDIKELRYFRETGSGGDIKAMRETWSDIVRLQAPLLLGGAVSVNQFRVEGPVVASHQPARPYDEAHPWDRFHGAMVSVIQAASFIIHTIPIHERSMKMRGGSVTT